MGNDEHGPAYPDRDPFLSDRAISPERHRKVYRCPICNGDENRYLSCEHPGCFDGRDRGHPHRLLRETYPTEDETAQIGPSWAQILIGWGFVIALILYMIWPVHAMDHGFNPDSATTKWFESKMRPDYPGSCCGKGDGYPVSDYWDNHDGTWTAVIGDGSAIKYPDGTTRDYIATGQKIIVPEGKVNNAEDDLDNPTDTSWIFMTVHAAEPGTIYCLIRHPQGG